MRIADCGFAEDRASGLSVAQVDWLGPTMAGDREYRWSRVHMRRAWFRRTRADVALFVQSSNTPFRAAVMGARLAGVPVVTTHRTMPYVRELTPSSRHLFGLIPGIGLHRRRVILKTWLTAALAERVVYDSEAVRSAYENEYAYPPRKGRVIVNAVDCPAEMEGTERHASSASHDDGDITIGYVGRLAEEKRLDVLVRAAAAMRTHRRVRLLMYGDGPERANLERLAAELGLADRITWGGVADDVWPAYKRMDIVACCSRREASSNMVLEAMAAGKAVVVSAVGGLPELIGEGRHGVAVPPLNVEALTRALERLVESDDQRKWLGERAREAARRDHDPEAIGRAWIEILEEAAGLRRRAVKADRTVPAGSPDLSAPASA